MSKGSQRRPQQIDEAEMERRWNTAFGKRKRTWREISEEGWLNVRREFPHLFANDDETSTKPPIKSQREGD